MSIPWLSFANRVRLASSVYAESLARPGTVNQRHVLEKFLKQLLIALSPHDPEQEPSLETLQQLQTQIRLGYFPLRPIASLIRRFQPLPVHALILDCFCQPRDFTDDEANLFERANIRDKSRFLWALNRLQRLRRKYDYPSDVPLNQIGNISLEHALAFCTTKISKDVIAPQVFLSLCGFVHMDELTKQFQTKTEARKIAKALFLEHKWPLNRIADTYMPMYNRVGHLALAVTTQPKDTLFQAIQHLAPDRTRFGVKMLAHFARLAAKEELAVCLEQYLAPSAAIERFRGRSTWHGEVVDCLIANARSKRGIAHIDRHIQLILGQFATFIRPIEQYAQRKRKGPDALRDFLAAASFGELREAIRVSLAEHKAQNAWVKTASRGHHALSAAHRALGFVKRDLRSFIGCRNELSNLNTKDVLQDIVNRRVPQDALVRRTFSDSEFESMLTYANNPFERLCLLLLREVGLRNGSLQHLRYDMLLDETHEPRHVCTVKEKGNKLRAFVCGPNLRAQIKVCSDVLRKHYDPEDLAGGYLLNFKNISKPLAPTIIGDMLKRIASAANITEVKVHAHAFRHTLVTKLVSAGNSLDVVAKFMGHADVRTTSYFYWIPQPEQVQKMLIDPFSSAYDEKEMKEGDADILVQAANAKLSAARHILDTVMGLCDAKQMSQLSALIPDFKTTLEAVDTPCALSIQKQAPTSPTALPIATANDFEPNDHNPKRKFTEGDQKMRKKDTNCNPRKNRMSSHFPKILKTKKKSTHRIFFNLTYFFCAVFLQYDWIPTETSISPETTIVHAFLCFHKTHFPHRRRDIHRRDDPERCRTYSQTRHLSDHEQTCSRQ